MGDGPVRRGDGAGVRSVAIQTFTRQLRDRALRPHCEACASSKGRAHVDIDHPPGEEIQWDWLELRDTPWGDKLYVLVGALSYSGKFRCWLSDADDQAHLIVGIDEILRRLGGTARRWRVDRMATVIVPGTDRIQRSFAPVAKHYGVGVDPCPPRHGNRKGVVEANDQVHHPTVVAHRSRRDPRRSPGVPRRFCVTVADARQRGDTTVAEMAATEPLLALPPVAYPAAVSKLTRKVADNALVSVWGNRYSVPPGLVGTEVDGRVAVGAETHRRHQRRRSGGRQPPPRTPRRGTYRAAPRTHRRAREGRARRVQQRTALRDQTQPATIGRGVAIAAEIDRPTTATSRPVTTSPPTSVIIDRERRAGVDDTRHRLYQQLRSHLAYLNLGAAAEALPAELDRAQPTKTSHTEFLEALLRIEVDATDARRLDGRMRFANFPAPWRTR